VLLGGATKSRFFDLIMPVEFAIQGLIAESHLPPILDLLLEA
jgi:hypothetical protein